MQGLHALFTGEDDTWEAWLNVDASGFSSVIGLGRNGIKLRRGYSTSHSPKPSQVSMFSSLQHYHAEISLPFFHFLLQNCI